MSSHRKNDQAKKLTRQWIIQSKVRDPLKGSVKNINSGNDCLTRGLRWLRGTGHEKVGTVSRARLPPGTPKWPFLHLYFWIPLSLVVFLASWPNRPKHSNGYPLWMIPWGSAHCFGGRDWIYYSAWKAAQIRQWQPMAFNCIIYGCLTSIQGLDEVPA